MLKRIVVVLTLLLVSATVLILMWKNSGDSDTDRSDSTAKSSPPLLSYNGVLLTDPLNIESAFQIIDRNAQGFTSTSEIKPDGTVSYFTEYSTSDSNGFHVKGIWQCETKNVYCLFERAKYLPGDKAEKVDGQGIYLLMPLDKFNELITNSEYNIVNYSASPKPTNSKYQGFKMYSISSKSKRICGALHFVNDYLVSVEFAFGQKGIDQFTKMRPEFGERGK